MKNPALQEIIKFARNLKYILLATAGPDGTPHVTAAGTLRYAHDDERITVSDWFCPQTVSNLQDNRQVSVIAWSAEMDSGYQIEGELTEVHNGGILNQDTDAAAAARRGRTDKDLLIKVRAIRRFSHAIHSDENILPLTSEIEHAPFDATRNNVV